MQLRRLSQSIITRMILLGMAIVLFGTVARYFALTKFVRDDLGAVVETQQLALANYVARDVDDKLQQRRFVLEGLAHTLPMEWQAQPARLRAWLGERQELLPLFPAGLSFVDIHGHVVADYPEGSQAPGPDNGSEDYFQLALGGSFVIGRPRLGAGRQGAILPMAAPVRDGLGRIRGVLVGMTPLGAPGFLDQLLHNRIGQTGGFLLISPQERLFVAASDPRMVLQPTPPVGANSLHDRAMAGFRGTGVTVNAKGVEEVVAIVSVPSAGWFVVARLPTGEAFEPVRRIQHYIVRSSTVVVVIFLLLAAGGLYVVFRPLLAAAAQADRMSRGELPLQPLPVVRHDEVGHLTSAFNRLLQRLGDSQAELARAAHHDVLTGLPNRMLLADRLHQAQALAKRHGGQIALLFLDLDGFKLINDSLGHEAGDEALRQVARRLSACVREYDTLARVGGDEFVILIGNLTQTPVQMAIQVAEKCIASLAAPLTVHGEACRLGVSVGIALGDAESSASAMLLAADQAMYRAKEGGRGRYVVAGEDSANPV